MKNRITTKLRGKNIIFDMTTQILAITQKKTGTINKSVINFNDNESV